MAFSEKPPPLIDRLRSILDSYPFSVGLFREFLQNSDDARATEQIFELDWRSHPTNSLYNAGLSATQGPALLAYNNALFNDEDWQSLQNLERSCKKLDDTKIGKFGMGFRSCYHITDTPQILSGAELAMLDPQKLTFKEGGVKYNFVDDPSYADQLSGFDSFISVEERDKPFNGTVIRLPLRSAPSSIRDTAVHATEIRDLLVEFIKAEIDASLLFLSRIMSIQVHEVNNEGRKCLVKVKKSHMDHLDYEIPHAKMCATSAIKTHRCLVTVDSGEDAPSCTTWRVLFSSHPPEMSQRILSDRLKFDQDSAELGSRLSSEKLLPGVGLAIPLSPQPAPRQGRLYTFLPLPLITGFPVHVHGLFALDSARRHLRGDVDAVNPQSTDKVRAEWNRVLFDTFVPFAWAHLFPRLVEDGFDDIYQAWPSRQGKVTAGDALFWRDIPSGVLDVVIENDLAVWPVDRNSREYKRLSEVYVVVQDDLGPATRRALRGAGLTITELPRYIFALLQLKGYDRKMLTPEIAHEELLNDLDSVRSLGGEDLDLLVEFLLSTGELTNIVDLPVIRLIDESRASLKRKAVDQTLHVLMSAADADIFGAYDRSAIKLETLPPSSYEIFRSNGPRELNLTLVTPDHVERYLCLVSDRHALKINGRPDPTAIAWLSEFWKWFGRQPFKRELYPAIESFYLIPTAEGDLESAKNGVVYFALGSSDALRRAFSLLSVSRLCDDFSDEARGSLVGCGCVKDPDDVRHFLTRATLDHGPSFDSETSEALLKHFVSSLPVSCRHQHLSEAQQHLFRSFPIFPRLLPPGGKASVSEYGAIPDGCFIVGVKNLDLLPVVRDVVYLDGSRMDLSILRFLPALPLLYKEYESPNWRILSLTIEHFPDQTKDFQLAFLEYIRFGSGVTVELFGRLERSPFILACDRSVQAPVGIVDPDSDIGRLFERASPRLPLRLDESDHRLVRALRDLELLGRRLTPEMALERIGYIDSSVSEHSLPAEVYAIATQLFTLMADVAYTRSVPFSTDQRWLPRVDGRIAAPSECRDGLCCPELFDEVLGLAKFDVASIYLRQALGWDEEIPLDVVKRQLMKVAMRSDGEKLLKIIVRLSKRDFGPDIADLGVHMGKQPWIPIDEGCIVTPDRVVVTDDLSAERLPAGFYTPQGPLGEDVVRRFLCHIGSPKRIPNVVLLNEMEKLPISQLSLDDLDNVMRLLENLRFESLSTGDQLRVLVPDRSGDLRPLVHVLYNDLDDRSCLVTIPDDKFFSHSSIGRGLARKLGMETLRAFSLGSEEDNDTEDMGETIQTKISNILLQYKAEQALGEFLANAIDAGAASFGILVDEFSIPSSRYLLTDTMDELVSCPALVIHNDTTFTEEDFVGIRRIGTGGKGGRHDTIGQFGLGSLSMFHFTEMAMILSRDQVLFLDPSKKRLADITKRNWLKLSLPKMRRLFQGHLEPLYGLFGFTAEMDYYEGTLIRLALRTSSQAYQSVLSKSHMTVGRVLQLVEEYRAVASQSFIFTENLTTICSTHRLPHGRSVVPLWNLSGKRERPRETGERAVCGLLDINSSSHACQEKWLVARTSQEIPAEFRNITKAFRLRSPVTAGLAARLHPSPTENQLSSTPCKFYSTLPLMVNTTLPVHCHGTFVLAPDRRSIRFDGDGRINPESEYNRWLLSNVLTLLYFCLLEELLRHGPNLHWWPGSKLDDQMTQCLVQSFYLKHLAHTDRPIFSSATNEGLRLLPRNAILSGKEPSSVKKIWKLFQCEEVVELQDRIRIRVADGVVKCVNSTYITEVTRRQSDSLSQAFRNQQLHCKDIKELVTYLLSDDAANMVGLPLIPLSDGTLGKVALRNPSEYIFWKPNYAGPAIIPSDRLVHHHFDGEPLKLFTKKYNVSYPSNSQAAIIGFVAAKVSEAPDKQNVSLEISDWIEHFWKEFESLKLSLEAISSYPLVRTIRENRYVSIKKCKALPVLLARNAPKWLVDVVSQLGAVVVSTPSYSPLLELLEKPPHLRLDFRGFLLFVASIESTFSSCFSQLKASEQAMIRGWIEEQIQPYIATQRDLVYAARLLPLWRSYSANGDEVFVSANEARMLPSGIDPGDAKRFSRALFIKYSYKAVWLNVSPMSWHGLYNTLCLPEALTTGDAESYKRILLLLLSRGDTTRILVPRDDLTLVNPNELFSRRVDLFWAALQTRPNHFIHTSFQEMQYSLIRFGMRIEVSVDSFARCAQVFHEDTSGPRRPERAYRIWSSYNDRLPLLIGPNQQHLWSQFASLRFIPRGSLFRSLELPNPVPSSELHDIVAPNNIVRPSLEAIVWTQRVSCISAPSEKLLVTQPNFGVPTVSEVVQHLRILALRVAPLYPSNIGVLADLKATYRWLNNKVQPHDQCIYSYRKEPLFLNVDDPIVEDWTWHCANNLLFDFDDSGCQYGVRSFLTNFKNLLLAAGAEEFRDPTCLETKLIPPDETLETLRAKFDDMRTGGILVDIEFKGSEKDAQPFGAHRSFLYTQSNYFVNLCQNDFREGNTGCVPILVEMKEYSTRCLQYVIEHIYTRNCPTLDDEEDMWEVLRLSHYWQLERLHLLQQRQLVASGCIPLLTSERRLLRQRAERYNAQEILKACDEFEKMNARPIERLDREEIQG